MGFVEIRLMMNHRLREKRFRIKTLGLLLLLVIAVSMVTPLVFASPHPAVAVIENLHTALLAVMKGGEKIGYTARYNRLAPVITACFNLPFIARTVTGRYWETLDADQRSRFVEAFSRLSIATYAANFDTYSGERFKVVSEKELSGGHVEVKTQLIRPDGEEVSLDYVLHLVDKQWRIINVIADGVSDLALKRADYSNFFKTKGFDALLLKLNEKIARYSCQSAE